MIEVAEDGNSAEVTISALQREFQCTNARCGRRTKQLEFSDGWMYTGEVVCK